MYRHRLQCPELFLQISEWIIPKGGAGALTQALASYLESLGGTVETGAPVTDLAELDEARAVLLDLTPRQVVNLAGDRLPEGYRSKLDKWAYGPGVFKVDWALDAPIPWTAEACKKAGTLHLGGTIEQIADSERAPWDGRVSDRPFVLLAQPSVFDDTRARLPVFDRAVAALIEDIYDRGLDKSVMVIVSGEFGRSPRINPQKGTQSGVVQPGRDHYPAAMSVLVSGGGMRTGQVIGIGARSRR